MIYICKPPCHTFRYRYAYAVAYIWKCLLFTGPCCPCSACRSVMDEEDKRSSNPCPYLPMFYDRLVLYIEGKWDNYTLEHPPVSPSHSQMALQLLSATPYGILPRRGRNGDDSIEYCDHVRFREKISTKLLWRLRIDRLSCRADTLCINIQRTTWISRLRFELSSRGNYTRDQFGDAANGIPLEIPQLKPCVIAACLHICHFALRSLMNDNGRRSTNPVGPIILWLSAWVHDRGKTT